MDDEFVLRIYLAASSVSDLEEDMEKVNAKTVGEFILQSVELFLGESVQKADGTSACSFRDGDIIQEESEDFHEIILRFTDHMIDKIKGLCRVKSASLKEMNPANIEWLDLAIKDYRTFIAQEPNMWRVIGQHLSDPKY
jgi:hypothetical protein